MPNAKTAGCAACLLLLLCIAVQALPVLVKPVTLNLREQPIEKILNEITRQTGIQFSYSPQALDVSRTASIEAHRLPVREALRMLFGEMYEYKAVRKFIILRKSRVEIHPLTTPQQQQQQQQQPTSAEKTAYSYITNQQYVKKLCYTDSGTTSGGCLSHTNNQNSKMMRKYLAAVALASVAGASAQAQQPSNASGQLEKAGKELVALVKEVSDSTAQAVKMAANEINRQASHLKTAGAFAEAPTKVPPAEAPTEAPPAAAPPAAASGDSVRPVIFTLLYPFSFPDLNTERYAYRASFTYLVGVNSGVSGTELGGLVNINRRYMSGVQLAGLANLSLGSVTGMQLAGVTNVAARDSAKAQLAGVANVAQGADFQAAGIANAAHRRANVQLAGIANATASAKLQAAGIANAAQRRANVQLASIANATDTSRCQVGLVNVARKAGIQVGLINVCDTSDGVMVGLVNVARRGGLYELEIGTDPMNHLDLTFRMGMKKFYTLAELSYRWDDRRWLSGVGLGTQISLPKTWSLKVEGASQHVLTSKFWQQGSLNLLAQARVAAAKQLTKHFALFAGPTFYVYCTNFTNPNSVDLSSPYHLFSVRGNRIATKAWVGLSMGVRIN
ncbi:MAG: hypothetical protein LBG47_03410 [Prevotellaceae bacterium]|jgi:hypothetical protein|nr:hypothetical protein [Prevotellaceae bacterium]